MKRLAIVITHPIQYYVPVFQLLAKEFDIQVFYTWGEECLGPKYDPGFGKVIDWDIPLLEGYEYEFLENTASNPGSHHRKGIINPDIVKRISTFEPNVLLVYGYAYDSHLKAMRYFKGKIPVWFRGDSTLLDKDSLVKSILKSIYIKWVYRYVDKAFYVGTNNKAYFKKYGLKEEQLVFAPHAIDNHRFAENREAEALELRAQLGIKPEDLLILFAGKLEPKKNPELLLDVFVALNKEISPQNLVEMTGNDATTSLPDEKSGQASMTKKGEMTAGSDFSTPLEMTRENEMTGRKVHLLFVGNGILEESLKLRVENINKEIASSLAMTKRIHFMDFQNQSQMPVVYQACDVFCLPSVSETWGLAINESMATGKAILASDKVGCAVDLVKDNVNGYIFESDNQADLQEKLKCLLKTNLVGYGKNSKKIIENWSFEKQVEAFAKKLEKC